MTDDPRSFHEEKIRANLNAKCYRTRIRHFSLSVIADSFFMPLCCCFGIFVLSKTPPEPAATLNQHSAPTSIIKNRSASWFPRVKVLHNFYHAMIIVLFSACLDNKNQVISRNCCVLSSKKNNHRKSFHLFIDLLVSYTLNRKPALLKRHSPGPSHGGLF